MYYDVRFIVTNDDVDSSIGVNEMSDKWLHSEVHRVGKDIC